MSVSSTFVLFVIFLQQIFLAYHDHSKISDKHRHPLMSKAVSTLPYDNGALQVL